MIISALTDYREAARQRLPLFLFHDVDDAAYAERTLHRNVVELVEVALSSVGIIGMYARRGEVQAAMAVDGKSAPFTLSSISVCLIEGLVPKIKRPMWFQLYVLKDRGCMKNAPERTQATGSSTLMFTVDICRCSARYHDAHSGMRAPTPRCTTMCRRC